jgi:hypothetical protein
VLNERGMQAMISNIQEKYDQLNSVQKDIFAGYGLRQIKHFIEYCLPEVQPLLPENSVIEGINTSGMVQAVQQETRKCYVWDGTTWNVSANFIPIMDTTDDFQLVWEIFDLSRYELIELSHVHRDFLGNAHV